jgi:hypothetical protein
VRAGVSVGEIQRLGESLTGPPWVKLTHYPLGAVPGDPIDSKRRLSVDDGAYEAELSHLIVQALHHGNIHREQVGATLTGLGIEPPPIQAWDYAEATVHARS